MRLYLASNSPRRKELLKGVGIEFEVLSANVEEDYPNHLSPIEIPTFIANKKANGVVSLLKNSNLLNNDVLVLAADTVVVLDNLILGKPNDRAEAIDMISQLSARCHDVITGVVIYKNGKTIQFESVTKVFFKPLTINQIEYYIDHYQPFDKAGGYAIQEWIGYIGVEKIEGDYYNVVGLPIHKVTEILNNLI